MDYLNYLFQIILSLLQLFFNFVITNPFVYLFGLVGVILLVFGALFFSFHRRL